MVVSGASAIAIAAALSLVIEAFNLQPYGGCPVDATYFLIEKLDYLVSSRPTVVNLSDSSVKIKEIISNSAAKDTEGSMVIQVIYVAGAMVLVIPSQSLSRWKIKLDELSLASK